MHRTLILILASAAALVRAQEAPPYRIERASSPITLDARLDEPAWQAARPVGDFFFNSFTQGEKEPTEARMLWDDENLYVSWRARDKHISAYVTERHGPVSRDDTAEIFLSPNPKKVTNYYTFEINVIGTMLNRCRTDWWTGPPTWEPEGVRYHTTFFGLPKKDEAPGDNEWIVELAIPLRNFQKDAASIPPRNGDEWRLNIMRTGGKTNAQQSTWSPLRSERKGFHTPENFGRVVFSTRIARARAVNAADAAAGRTLYNSTCTQCHGLDGAAGDRAPALGAQRRYLRSSDADVFDATKNGIPGTLMPAMKLPDADIWKIVAYVRSLRATAVDVPVEGDIARGETLFHGKGQCAGCHMIRGRGGLAGPDLSDLGAERRLEEIRQALTVPKPVPPRGYQPVEARTRAGVAIKGIVKNENNFSLQVLSTDGKLHLLDRAELAAVRYPEKSLMPANFDKVLTTGELRDLVAFLSRQARRRSE